MKKLLGILVLGLLWCNVGFAECVKGTDIYGNSVVDCSTSGGGYWTETSEGSETYTDIYNSGSNPTSGQEIIDNDRNQ